MKFQEASTSQPKLFDAMDSLPSAGSDEEDEEDEGADDDDEVKEDDDEGEVATSSLVRLVPLEEKYDSKDIEKNEIRRTLER